MSLAVLVTACAIGCLACASHGYSSHVTRMHDSGRALGKQRATSDIECMSDQVGLAQSGSHRDLRVFNPMTTLAVFLLAFHPAVGWRFITAGRGLLPAPVHCVVRQRHLDDNTACQRRPDAAVTRFCPDNVEMSSSTSKTNLQSKTWEFLKSKRLVGINRKLQKEAGAPGKPRMQYSPDKAVEKRALKRKILAGEELAKEERQRLEELKALNKAKKVEELAAQGPILRKNSLAFRSCNMTGVIDSVVERFPTSSCGTDWRLTMGKSRGEFFRSTLDDRACNLLRVEALDNRTSNSDESSVVHLSLQLSNELPPGMGTINASKFAGIEVDIFCPRTTTYSLLLKTPDCKTPPSYYRAFFQTVALKFVTVRLPWSEFVGEGAGAEEAALDVSHLGRLSLELGRCDESEEIAVAGIKFLLPLSDERQKESQANTWKFLKDKHLVGEKRKSKKKSSSN